MSDILKPYIEATFSAQVHQLVSKFIDLYNRYTGWSNAIHDYYHSQIVNNPTQPWQGAAAEKVNVEVSTLAGYAPPRLDLSGKQASNLQNVLTSLRGLIRHLEDHAYSYEYTHVDDGFFSGPGNLETVSQTHNDTNKDYARYILNVQYNDFSHPVPIAPMLSSGRHVLHEAGWQPDDPQNQSLKTSTYIFDIQHVMEEWADNVHSTFQSWLSGSNSGTGPNMQELTADLLHNRNGVPTIHQETFGPYMTNAQLYDFIALGEVKSNVQDKVGFTPVTIKGSGNAVLVTLPGTQPDVSGQVNDLGDAILASEDLRTQYETMVENYIAAYLKEHPNAHFIFAGHSYGGMVAQQILEDTEKRHLGYNIDEIITYGSPYVYEETQNAFGALPPPMIQIPHHMYYNADDVVMKAAKGDLISGIPGPDPWAENYETQVDNPLPFDITNPLQSHDYSGSKQLLNTTVDFTIAGGTQYYNLNRPSQSPIPPPDGPTPTPNPTPTSGPQPTPVPGPVPMPTSGPTPPA